MLLREVSAALERLQLRGARLLVAVSGGIDSVTLLHALDALAEEYSLKLLIGHVNHGLRGAESDADQEFVEGLGAPLGLVVHTARVAPREARAGRASRDRPTLQEAARELRYQALGRLAAAAGADAIATAHSADDQAETVLLRLLRGTGPDGLAGIPERSPHRHVVRPLLRVPRSEIERFAAERRLSWREDASNADPAYARNRLRQHWLPGLAGDFNPRLLKAIGDLAEAQRRDSEWIATRVEQEAAARFTEEGPALWIDAKDFGELPEALGRRLARAALARCGSGRLVTRRHLERMLAFLSEAVPGRRLELPGDLVLERRGGVFRLAPRSDRRPGGGRTPC